MKRTALRPGKALARGRGLKRTGRLQVHPWRSRTDPAAVAALAARSGGRCEADVLQESDGIWYRVYPWPRTQAMRCDQPATDPHHRRSRARAGKRDDSLSNLLHLCRWHHDWVDDHPAEAEHLGWLLPSDH